MYKYATPFPNSEMSFILLTDAGRIELTQATSSVFVGLCPPAKVLEPVFIDTNVNSKYSTLLAAH